LLDQTPPPTVEVNVEVPPIQSVWAPDIIPGLGGGIMVTGLDIVADAHPPTPATVYVIKVEPDETPEINPVVGFTVAIAVLLLLQIPPVTVDMYVVVPPKQIESVPLKVPALGGAVTVTIRVAVAAGHPPVPATV